MDDRQGQRLAQSFVIPEPAAAVPPPPPPSSGNRPAPSGELTSYGELADLLGSLPILLRAERRRRQLSLRAVALELGCAFSTVYRIEEGGGCELFSAIAVLRWLGSTDG